MKAGNKIFFVLCAITIIVGAIIYLETSLYRKNAKITDGTVINTGISSYEVRYTSDDGVERVYKGNHGSSKGWSYHDGDIVKVFYKADNPDKMRFSDGINFCRKVVNIGIIMLLLNLVLIYFDRKKGKTENSFKLTGKKLQAQIVNMGIDTSVSVLRKNPFFVDCKWTDPSTGREYTHTIQYIWKDPKMLLAGRDSVDVYIDPNNPHKYLLDISFLGAGAK